MFSERDYYRNPEPRRRGFAGMSGTGTLILINIACFVLANLSDFFLNKTFLAANAPLQVWRLFTYQFIHKDFWHIFLNMYGLWLFGRYLEGLIGKARLIILYLFCGVLGGIFFLIANWGTPAGCIGASGAEFGIMVATAIAFPKVTFFLIFPPLPVKLWVLALVYVGLELIANFNGSQDGIAHMAHLGGALGGLLYMKRLIASAMGSAPRTRRTAPRPTPEPAPAYDDSEPYAFDQKELDRILDKMSRQGYGQLTERERNSLRRFSEELKKRQ